MLLSRVFAGARNDLQTGVQPACRKDDVQIRRVGRGCSDQALCSLDLCLSQGVLQRGVSGQHQPVLGSKALSLPFCTLDDDEWHGLARQFASHAAADTSHTADDEVAVETSDFALHATPSEEALQLEF